MFFPRKNIEPFLLINVTQMVMMCFINYRFSGVENSECPHFGESKLFGVICRHQSFDEEDGQMNLWIIFL